MPKPVILFIQHDRSPILSYRITSHERSRKNMAKKPSNIT